MGARNTTMKTWTSSLESTLYFLEPAISSIFRPQVSGNRSSFLCVCWKEMGYSAAGGGKGGGGGSIAATKGGNGLFFLWTFWNRREERKNSQPEQFLLFFPFHVLAVLYNSRYSM